MKRPGLSALLLLTLLLVGALVAACGETGSIDDTPVPAADSSGGGAGTTPAAGAASGTQAPASGGSASTGAKVGDAVPVADYTVSLDSAKIADGLLQAQFTFDNTKGADLLSIRLNGFSAKTPDGSTLDVDIVCSTLAGRVDIGKKVQGLNCWKTTATSTTGIKVTYALPKSAGNPIVWTLP